MKKLFLFGGMACAILATVFVACKKENAKDGFGLRGTHAGPFVDTVTLPRIISASRTLTADTLYLLNNKTFVTNGAVLTIQAGGRVEGVPKALADSASALVITRGAKIIAQGTPSAPIIFTSFSNDSTRVPGKWGGVVILGRSTVNKSNPAIEGINPPTVPATVDYQYGGTIADDSSGVFSYVRIEYAGAAIAANNELNGLTLGGVGCRTKLDHVQVSYGADDAFEFFGGTVNAKYLIALAPNDDCFDFDFGYRGKIQFALSVLKQDLAQGYSSDPNGIECDNDGSGTADAPLTRPAISNMTIVGTNGCVTNPGTLLNGARFRRNSRFVLRNSVILGYPNGILLESTGTQNSLNCSINGCDSSQLLNNAIHGCTTSSNGVNAALACGSFFTTTLTAVALRNPFLADFDGYKNTLTRPLAPADGTPAASGTSFTGLPGYPTPGTRTCGTCPTTTGSFAWDSTSYKGAVPNTAAGYWLSEAWIDFTPPTL
jgi:hypothetical protein